MWNPDCNLSILNEWNITINEPFLIPVTSKLSRLDWKVTRIMPVWYSLDEFTVNAPSILHWKQSLHKRLTSESVSSPWENKRKYLSNKWTVSDQDTLYYSHQSVVRNDLPLNIIQFFLMKQECTIYFLLLILQLKVYKTILYFLPTEGSMYWN